MNYDDRELLTVREAARRLGLRESTVRAWLQQRRIEKVKLGRAVRIPRRTLEVLIERGTVQAKQNR
jgi:excisionase family DNA binding protein